MIKILPGQQIGPISEEEIVQFQLDSFTPDRCGFGPSSLAQYQGYYFSWIATNISSLSEDDSDDEVETFEKVKTVYHLTMIDNFPLIPLNTPTQLSNHQILSYGLDTNGRSCRSDLVECRFQVQYLGMIDGQGHYMVTRKK